MQHRSAEECRAAGITYHLVPEPVWSERGRAVEYLPEAYDADRFIHCTNGLDPLLTVGNTFYKQDCRQFLVLVLDMARVSSRVQYDDDARVFPHIYGPLNTDAVVGRLSVKRGVDGAFEAFSPV